MCVCVFVCACAICTCMHTPAYTLKKTHASCGYVSKTVWMHHLDLNETHEEKVRWIL